MRQGHEIITVDPNNAFEVAQAEKVTPFIPAGFHSTYKFAELIAASGMAPKDMNSTEKIAVAIFHGMEVGLTPMAALQSIAVINGRPSIWGDGALAMVRGSGELDDIEEFYEGGDLWSTRPEYDQFGKPTKAGVPNHEYKAVCRITRKGKKKPVDYEFSVGDAMQAGLWNKEGPWRNYTKRMLKMRARSFALRDEFTDVMRGLVLAEEAQDMVDVTPRGGGEPPAPPPTTAAAQQQAIEGEIAAPKRGPGRPRKDNKYQADEGDQTQPVEEAEIVEESPPAPPAAKPAAKPAEQQAAPKAASKGDAFIEGLISEVGPDKPLKDYLANIHKLLSGIGSIDDMKGAWLSRPLFKGATKAQEVFIYKLRDWHKERVAEPAAEENPPAPPAGKSDEGDFDFAGFLHHLDVELGGEKNADGVNALYADLTAEPIRLKVVSEQQVEEDLKPILAQHLERVDYGG